MSSHLGADEWKIENLRLVSTCYQLIRANWVIRAAAPVGLPDGRRWCTPSLWDGRLLASLCVMVSVWFCSGLWYPISKKTHMDTPASTLALLGRVYKHFPSPSLCKASRVYSLLSCTSAFCSSRAIWDTWAPWPSWPAQQKGWQAG